MTVSATAPVLAFDNVHRAFERGKPVLAGVTLTVAPNEVVALLGRNGAGKTTLLQLAMGLLHPQQGSVRAFGLVPTEEPVAVKRRIGYVSEQSMVPPMLSIWSLIALHRKLYPTWDVALERELLARFGVTNLDAKLATVSKGQRQQVALVCALAHRPELLILDEPASGLDPAARREMLETSMQLLHREGTAILFSSHHLTDVERLGGRAVVLDGGRIRLDKPLDDLREACAIVIVRKASVANAAGLERVPGCLRVRDMGSEWHAVFDTAPETARARVEGALGPVVEASTVVPLEELFIELLGGQVPTVGREARVA